MSCEFCGDERKAIDSEIAELVEITELPAINLTTGEQEAVTGKQFYAIRVLWVEDGYDTVEDYIPIKYCPKCGRKLQVED